MNRALRRKKQEAREREEHDRSILLRKLKCSEVGFEGVPTREGFLWERKRMATAVERQGLKTEKTRELTVEKKRERERKSGARNLKADSVRSRAEGTGAVSYTHLTLPTNHRV